MCIIEFCHAKSHNTRSRCSAMCTRCFRHDPFTYRRCCCCCSIRNPQTATPLGSATFATAADVPVVGETEGSQLPAIEGSSPYSPPDLIESLRHASENSGRLGVEGIFSAMARSPVFMNQVCTIWAHEGIVADPSLLVVFHS